MKSKSRINYLNLSKIIGVSLLFISLNFVVLIENFTMNISSAEEDTFPFPGQYNTYQITQTIGSIIASSGTLTVSYDNYLNNTAIFGSFHIEVTSLLEFYNESADGSENLNTRHLYIDSSDTYMIYIFMEYFFIWVEGEVTPTPMWIFPQDLELNRSVKFWNYYGNCSQRQSISIMDKYHEVFVFRVKAIDLNMTLMYGKARNNSTDWYGLLYYMSASFFEPVQNRILHAYFKLIDTNAELLPLDELNQKNILAVTISFYSLIVVGSIIIRVRRRRELIGGEV